MSPGWGLHTVQGAACLQVTSQDTWEEWVVHAPQRRGLTSSPNFVASSLIVCVISYHLNHELLYIAVSRSPSNSHLIYMCVCVLINCCITNANIVRRQNKFPGRNLSILTIVESWYYFLLWRPLPIYKTRVGVGQSAYWLVHSSSYYTNTNTKAFREFASLLEAFTRHLRECTY